MLPPPFGYLSRGTELTNYPPTIRKNLTQSDGRAKNRQQPVSGYLSPVFSPVIERLLFLIKSSLFAALSFLKMMLLANITFSRIIVSLPLVAKTLVFFTVAFFKMAPAVRTFFSGGRITLSIGMTMRMTERSERF